MTTVNLKDKLLGHVVLWAKMWYDDHSPQDLSRLSEVMVEYCGLPEGYQVGVKQAFDLVSEAATEIGVKTSDVSASFLRRASDRSEKITYSTKLDDLAEVGDLFWAMVSCITSVTVNSADFKVELPPLLPKMKEKYDLDPENDRERQA